MRGGKNRYIVRSYTIFGLPSLKALVVMSGWSSCAGAVRLGAACRSVQTLLNQAADPGARPEPGSRDDNCSQEGTVAVVDQ